MRSETYFATMAQVMPTLLIALILELRAIQIGKLRQWVAIIEAARDQHRDLPPSIQSVQTAATNWQLVTLAISIVFVVAELSTVAVLLFGLSNHRVAGPIGLVCALVTAAMCVVAVAAPIANNRTTKKVLELATDLEGLRRVIDRL